MNFELTKANSGTQSVWNLAQLLVFFGLNLQVSTHTPCVFYDLVVDCASKKLHWVPALPPNITHLYLGQNYISEINSTSLRDYDQLQDLDLGWQQVQLIIRNNAFQHQGKLMRLVLSQFIAGLQLELRAFEGLVNLRQLYMDSSKLTDSILSEMYMEPLLSLEELDLSYNKIARVRPGLFFSNLTMFTTLKLKSNSIERLCEKDLDGFMGKTFLLMDLYANHLGNPFEQDSDWEGCGNPFRGIDFITLNISSNNFRMETATRFFKTIQGTLVSHLVFKNGIGKGFSHDNFPDPDEETFKGLMNSSVEILDLSQNNIFALQAAVFSPLKTAKIIDISKNDINRINRDAFSGLHGHLRMLNLSSNLLGEILSYTFNGLTDLRVLDLSKNHIGVLGYQAFSGLPNLRGLFLTGNSLRKLDSPASLPKLELLLLGDNKLDSIYGISIFGESCIHVDVENNRLTNLQDVFEIATNFKRIEKLFIGGNFIKWCEPSPVPYNNSLKVLDLHDNALNALWAGGKCLNLFDHFENLLGLNLTFNLLIALPQGIFKGLTSIRQIDLSYNALTYLQPGVFPGSLKLLHISHNFLASPDPTSFWSLTALDLAENRFHCDCNLESFFMWLSVTNVTFLSPFEEYRCEFPADLYNRPLLDYLRTFEPCVDEEQAAQDVMLALFLIFSPTILAITLGGIVYARFRGRLYVVYRRILGRVLEGPKPTPLVEEGQYDAFFCFASCDYAWVEAALLKQLDNQFSDKNALRCCFESRDFLPGEDHLSNIRDAVWNSRKTVCVVSRQFLKDGWCLEAFTLAQGRMLEELRNVLVMMVVGKVAHYELMKHNAVRAFVEKRQYLVWPEDPQDLEWFYEQLLSQILKNTNVIKVTDDKAEPVKPENADIQIQLDDGVELEKI